MKSSEFKKQALDGLVGKWSKAISITFFYAVMVFLATYLVKFLGAFGGLLQLISFIFLIPISFGITVSIIKLINGDDVPLTEFINVGLKNVSKVWSVNFNMLLKILAPCILAIIVMAILGFSLSSSMNFGEGLEGLGNLIILILIFSLLALILSIVITVLLIPYAMSFFILYEQPEMSSNDIVNASKDMMNGHKKRFVLLMLSFIGWFILFVIIGSIVNSMFTDDNVTKLLSYAQTVLLTPYITAAQYFFYKDLKGNNVVKTVEEPVEEKTAE